MSRADQSCKVELKKWYDQWGQVITTPTSPQTLGSINTLGFASAVAISGTYAYVADGNAGLAVIPLQCE